MALVKGDKVTLHGVNESRRKMNFPEINEDIEGREVTVYLTDIPHHDTMMCRVTGIDVTLKMEGSFWKAKPKDIRELLIPESCLKIK